MVSPKQFGGAVKLLQGNLEAVWKDLTVTINLKEVYGL